MRTSIALLPLLLTLVFVAGAVLVGARLLQPAPDLGIFAPVVGRIVYGDAQGIWGVDPDAPAVANTRVLLTSEAGIPLGWSSDGTQLLILRGRSPKRTCSSCMPTGRRRS